MPKKMHAVPRLKLLQQRGFTLAEVCVAIVVCAMFGLAAFETNQRLLYALKSQKETTAATMVLQQRMEIFRATAFSNFSDKNYIKQNILTQRTGSEGPLGNLTEVITVSAYPYDGSNTISVSWDAKHTNGQDISNNSNLDTYQLLRVDVTETWTSANGRQRTRQLSSIFGVGNIGP